MKREKLDKHMIAWNQTMNHQVSSSQYRFSHAYSQYCHPDPIFRVATQNSSMFEKRNSRAIASAANGITSTSFRFD